MQVYFTYYIILQYTNNNKAKQETTRTIYYIYKYKGVKNNEINDNKKTSKYIK